MKRVTQFLVLLWLCLTGDAAGQTPLRVVVEYITAKEVYLSAGQLQGLFANDTVTAQRSGSLGAVRLAIVSSSRTRAVAAPADSQSVPLARGEVLFISVSVSAARRAEELRLPRPVVADSVPAGAVANVGPNPRRTTGAQTSGRIGFEVDAIRTSIRYGDGESQTAERTYLTPTIRMRMRTEHLPGGLRFSTNLRATQLGRTGEANEIRFQLYQASLEGDIKPAGLHFQLGRFYNSYESHSGYWDGVLIRVGSNRMGAGVIAGYTPERGNETLSSVSPKMSAFVDAHARRGNFGYDIDVSAHQQSNVFLAAEREFIGVSQSISIGRTYLTQRVQFGKTAGRTELWQAQLTGSALIAGPLSVNARYTTERNDLYFGGPSDLGRRTRMSAGAVLSGRAGFANVEAGTVDPGLGSVARTGSLNFFLPRALVVAGIGFSGNVIQDDVVTSTYVAPYVERYHGRFRARVGASYFRTDYATTRFEQMGGDLSLALPLGKRSELGWTAGATTGSNMQTARTSLTFWQSF
jgi:hypothetical protein